MTADGVNPSNHLLRRQYLPQSSVSVPLAPDPLDSHLRSAEQPFLPPVHPSPTRSTRSEPEPYRPRTSLARSVWRQRELKTTGSQGNLGIEMSVRARFGSGRKGARGVRRTILRVRQGWVGLGGSGGMVHREICHRVVASSPLAGGQPRPIQASGDGRSRSNNRNPFSSLSSDQGEGRAKGWGGKGGFVCHVSSCHTRKAGEAKQEGCAPSHRARRRPMPSPKIPGRETQ